MKKNLLYILGLMLIFGAASCSKSENKQEAAAQATEQPAKKDFISNLVAKDSTVKVTPSGLAYKVISEGNGERPNATSTVAVYYIGKHTDGTSFDGPHDDAIEFPLQGVIPGFSEGLQLMDKGSHYELYIPGNLGYGERGIPGLISPNETLVFDVELVDFK